MSYIKLPKIPEETQRELAWHDELVTLADDFSNCASLTLPWAGTAYRASHCIYWQSNESEMLLLLNHRQSPA